MARLWRFAHDWLVPTSVEDVYAVCAAVDAYPTWWREIRSIGRVDAESGWAEVRSVLPYTLRMLITREIEDEPSGRLRVRLEGDLTGWAEFRVSPSEVAGANSVAAVTFRQEVEVTARGLRWVAPVFAPALRANHTAMMHSCERGMRQVLG